VAVDEGEPIRRDLCDEDAAPLLDLLDLPEAEEPEPAPAETKPPAQRKAAKKATDKKATAPRRRGRTPVTTLDEIEARKAAAAKQ
jgi:hypothetical protein